MASTNRPVPAGDDRGVTLGVLAELVTTFMALESAEMSSFGRKHHAALAAMHGICAQLMACEDTGASRGEIVEVLAPLRDVHSRSRFVSRLQQWPRGYPGDFETVEYLCRGVDASQEPTLALHCETYSLNFPIAQQHRNKVHHQAGRILRTVAANDDARILILACGGCPDLRLLVPVIRRSNATLILNDADPNALAFAESQLEEIRDRCELVEGNAIKLARRLAGRTSFDLVLAGGLFDYLPDRHASYLIATVHDGLLRDGGTFFFTNIAEGNPYRVLIEYVGDWFLIERSSEELRRLCPAGAEVRIRRDESGLAFLVEVS